MKVTVCMINYNQEKFIKEAIESVLKQECEYNLELIISDDCSSDNSKSIVKSIIKYHPKGNLITLVERGKNLGMTSNFFETFKLCKGDFIALCDSDDFWRDKYKLQKQIDFLDKNKDYVVSFHDVTLFDENSKKINRGYIINKVKRDYISIELACGAFLMPVTMCFRNVITEIPEEAYKVTNWDVFLISMLGGFGKAKFMNDIIPAGYRLHQNNVSGTLTEVNKDYQRKVTFYYLFKYYNRIKKTNIAYNYFLKYNRSIKELIKHNLQHKNRLEFLKLYFSYLDSCIKHGYFKRIAYITKDVLKFVMKKYE
ncbi:glycosyltransferase [Lutibacter sp.]|uniref:glycosyltransferase n=1 Tax=Lutibacter sp. TaxID=1925666 RepID=UPI003562B0D0